MKNSFFTKRKALFIGQLLNAGAGFLTISILVKKLPKEVFGNWVLYLTIYGLIELLRTGLVYQALVQIVHQNSSVEQKRSLILGGRQLNFVVGVGVSIFCIVSIILNLFSEYTAFLASLTATSLLTGPLLFRLWLCQSKENYLEMWLLQLLQILPLLLYVSLSTSLNLLNLLLVHGGTRLVLSSFCYFTNELKFKESISISWFYVKKVFSFSRYTTISTLASQALKSSDLFLINHFMGSAYVAIYHVPLKLLEIVELPLRAWMVSSYPQMVKLIKSQSSEKFKSFLSNEVIKASLITAGLSITVYLLSNHLIELFAGSGYQTSAILLHVFLLYILIVPADKYMGVALDAAGLPNINASKVTIMFFINIIGDYIVLSNGWPLVFVALISLITTLSGVIYAYLKLIYNGNKSKFAHQF